MRIPRETFEQLVAQALDKVPEEFAERLNNVEVVVEDWAAEEDLAKTRAPRGALILGIYRGLPLTRQSVFHSFEMPARIVIFQEAIERVCRTPAEIVEQVKKTVLHEIAHHFGISDRRLRELGY
jgi:predicted Zn-dependent protease with MMP-like domain